MPCLKGLNGTMRAVSGIPEVYDSGVPCHIYILYLPEFLLRFFCNPQPLCELPRTYTFLVQLTTVEILSLVLPHFRFREEM